MLPEQRPRRSGRVSGMCRALAAIVIFSIAPARVILLSAKEVPAAASASITYDGGAFVHQLGRLKSELQVARKSPAGVQAFRESLPEFWILRVDGEKYQVSSSPVTSRIDEAEKEPAVRELKLDQARDFLDALASETASAAGMQPPDISSAQSELSRIVARPEFANRRKQSWWDRLRDRMYQMFFDALFRLLSRVGGQKSMGEALLWLGVCAAAILIAYWIFRRWFRAARMEEMALQSAGVPARSWQQWIFSARAAAAQSDFRLAIHCAYWAGIARLEELGALPADRAKTPREYLRTLTKGNPLVSESHSSRFQALSKLTLRLEKIWYGYHIATETDFLDSLSQLEVLGCHLP